MTIVCSRQTFYQNKDADARGSVCGQQKSSCSNNWADEKVEKGSIRKLYQQAYHRDY